MTSPSHTHTDPWAAFGVGVLGGVVGGLSLLSFAGIFAVALIAILGGIAVRPRPFGAAGVVFFAAFIGVMAALSLAGAAIGKQDERFAQALLYGATAGYLLAGVVGLASIGLPLVLAGLLALVAAGPRRLPVVVVATVAAVPLSAFLIGLALT